MRQDKRRAILDGALVQFARDGYSRATVDAIANDAAVSTRTIYKHFRDKAELFATVICESATRVADAQIAIIERHLATVRDAAALEAELVALGTELATPMTEFRDHFSLVRHVNADLEHIPQAAIDAWQQAGPRRVIGSLAERLRTIAERGLLRLDPADDSAEQATAHYMVLVQGAVPFHHGPGANRAAEVDGIVRAGVRVFLYGYASS